MKFRRVNFPPAEDTETRNVCYLVNDNWDDFGFKTAFGSVLFDKQGVRHELGALRALPKGWKGGRVPLPQQFTKLDEDWCSLGSGREYYIALSKLNQDVRESYLRSLRDCVFDPQVWQAFRSEEGLQSSLLRDVSIRDVEINFPRILRGDSTLTAYKFFFEFDASDDGEKERCEFSVVPKSKPPSNIHVLIGRNGVGKTRLLAGMADALTENKAATIGLHGDFSFVEQNWEENEFLNIVVVSYSAFDRFDPIFESGRKSKKSIPYYYIGIKKQDTNFGIDTNPRGRAVLKTSMDFDQEFSSCLETIRDDKRSGNKHERWLSALQVLRSDPGLADFADNHLLGSDSWIDGPSAQFSSLSSGHKIVLLTLAKLVEFINDRSLVLIDEPETHLHPPLLGSFVRAISELLISRNAVAIVATHSPVVVQEVPAKCVSVITRSGSRIRVRRPGIETFAENVGVLTRKIFGLEVKESGFYRLLRHSADGREFSEVIDEFAEQIGSEGRALARAFTIEDESE